jgi:hypothetical protein
LIADITPLVVTFRRSRTANDIDVLNELFWNDPLTIRYGTAENLYGHAAIATFRTTRTAAQHAREVTKTARSSGPKKIERTGQQRRADAR